MHKPESILEDETHKILCDFDKRKDHLRRAVLVLTNKKEKKLSIPVDCRVKIKNQKDRQIFASC